MNDLISPLEFLSPAQINAARRAVAEWVSILWHEECGSPSPADADHSSLLYRLLSGKKALLIAPPLRYSYPDYVLGEGKPVQICECYDIDEDSWGHFHCRVVIDQSPYWVWIDKDRKWLLHLTSIEPYRLEGKILQKLPIGFDCEDCDGT